MIKQQIKTVRYKEILFLGVLSILCFSLSVFRFIFSDTKLFLFLNWNLFLAFLPWFFSSLLIVFPALQKRYLLMGGIILAWLLFFPNAPYILTDLFHLRKETTMPIWFDLILILSFAWVGLLFGVMSLWDIEKIITKIIGKGLATFISICLLFLGSFGVYIGRYLRWNSWDIITRPNELVYDIGIRIANPFQHTVTWGMTFFMFLFLGVVYGSLSFIREAKHNLRS